jgi:CRISPR/Cas system CSM-associated protein Csm3 (group 7 of RAMP superfamily)
VERYRWLKGEPQGQKQMCDVCWLFGSPFSASRIFFQDGALADWCDVIERRDGVVIDRDSERARDRLKYDFEVVPANTSFDIRIEVENPSEIELALIAIGLSEWQQGIRLGGGVSRGLGQASLQGLKIETVDFGDSASCLAYCLVRKMQEVKPEEWNQYLKEYLPKSEHLNKAATAQ